MAEDAKLEIVLKDDSGGSGDQSQSRWQQRGYATGEAAESYNEARRQRRSYDKAVEGAGGEAAYSKQAREEFNRFREMGRQAAEERKRFHDQEEKDALKAVKEAKRKAREVAQSYWDEASKAFDDAAKAAKAAAKATQTAKAQAGRAHIKHRRRQRKSAARARSSRAQTQRNVNRLHKRHRQRQVSRAKQNRAARKKQVALTRHAWLTANASRIAWARNLLRAAKRFLPLGISAQVTKTTGSRILGAGAGILGQQGIEAGGKAAIGAMESQLAAGGSGSATSLLGAAARAIGPAGIAAGAAALAIGALAVAVVSATKALNALSQSIEPISGHVQAAKIRAQYAEWAAMVRRDRALGSELARWEDMKTELRTYFQDLVTGLSTVMIKDLRLLDLVEASGKAVNGIVDSNFFLKALKEIADFFVQRARAQGQADLAEMLKFFDPNENAKFMPAVGFQSVPHIGGKF